MCKDGVESGVVWIGFVGSGGVVFCVGGYG